MKSTGSPIKRPSVKIFFLAEGTDEEPTMTWWCNSEDFADEAEDWDIGFCSVITAEPEPEPVAVIGCMDDTANNYNADATEDSDPSSCTFDVVEPEPEPKEEADEVPGFGLLSAVAAIGVVLLLRRRL